MRMLLIRNTLLGVCVAVTALSSAVASASEDLDVTMRMVTDDEALTDSVVREIRLERPIGLGQEPGVLGEDVAREAREKGREFGQDAAERAREAGQLRDEVREAPMSDNLKPEIPDAGKPGTDRPQPAR